MLTTLVPDHSPRSQFSFLIASFCKLSGVCPNELLQKNTKLIKINCFIVEIVSVEIVVPEFKTDSH
jgi:hypothetical protein